jgi:cation:H+ antiporter
VAAFKKETDIAVGNVIGSNIFNIFLVLGLTSFLHPVDLNPTLVFDALFLLGLSVLLFVLVIRKKELSRGGGFVLLACYGLYLVSLALKDSLLAFFNVL